MPLAKALASMGRSSSFAARQMPSAWVMNAARAAAAPSGSALSGAPHVSLASAQVRKP
jgi:hypothetical protein